ncbi:MAG: hypothetical protein WBC70_18655 [Candidatus Aminicenantales bacterium]
MKRAIPVAFCALGVIGGALPAPVSQTTAKPRFKLYPLELKLAVGDTYCVPRKLASSVATLESYQERFVNHHYLLREEWSHPAYVFYQLDYYREMKKDTNAAILGELKSENSRIESELQTILRSYKKGAS